MLDFNYSAPTKIMFGEGQVKNLPGLMEQFGKKVLLAYGGGSIKNNGIYDDLKNILVDFELFELSGIEPNPKVATVNKGAEICKANEIDMILAVGGGSTIDCAKAVAAASFYDGDAWDLVIDHGKINNVLPIIAITTMAATGSETDMFGVISKPEINEKMSIAHPLLTPKISVLDPTYTYSVPKSQTAAGIADIMSHVMEVYFTNDHAYLANEMCEGIMRTCIKFAPVVFDQPENYDARSEILWANTAAMNGISWVGKGQAWSCHPIEHELSAFYDITHGVGLAIITPKWMRYILSEENVDQFVRYATNVWGIEPGKDAFAIAKKGIDALENFFISLDIPTNLSVLDIDDRYFDEMAEHAVATGGLQYGFAPLSINDVREILKMCL